MTTAVTGRTRASQAGVFAMALATLPFLSVLSGGVAAAPVEAKHAINTWLVAGTFDNDADNRGFAKDWVCSATSR